MPKNPEAYPLRYLKDFLSSSTNLSSNYRHAQQDIIFHYPARLSFTDYKPGLSSRLVLLSSREI